MPMFFNQSAQISSMCFVLRSIRHSTSAHRAGGLVDQKGLGTPQHDGVGPAGTSPKDEAPICQSNATGGNVNLMLECNLGCVHVSFRRE